MPYGATIKATAGDEVDAGAVVANWDPHTRPIVTEVAGKVVFENMEEGITVRRQTDELTGLSSISVIDPKDRPSAGKDVRPAVLLVDGKGKSLVLPGDWLPAHYFLKQMPFYRSRTAMSFLLVTLLQGFLKKGLRPAMSRVVCLSR